MFKIGYIYEDTLGGRWLVKEIVEVRGVPCLLVHQSRHLVSRWHIAVVDGNETARIFTKRGEISLLGDHPL